MSLFKELSALAQPYAKKDPRFLQIILQIAKALGQDETNITSLQGTDHFFRVRFELPGVLANATDVLPARYSVRLPRDESNNLLCRSIQLQRIGITAKIAPGADLVLDLNVSNDFGVTFKSLFSTDLINKPTLPAGLTRINNTFFSINSLNEQDMLSVDIISADGTVAGVEFDLMGRLVTL